MKEDKENKQKEDLTVPKELGYKQIVTKVTTLSQAIKDKLMQLKDIASMEVLLPVHTRMQKRLESIKGMSSAEHIKVRNHWKTTEPQIHIAGLEGRKINNDEAEIHFGVYEVDEKGNKKLYEHYADIEQRDGSKVRRVTSAEYRIAYEVTEKIKNGKAITREVMRVDRIQEDSQ